MKGTVKNKWVHGSIIGVFVVLYFMVSIISTIHVIDFFKLSNPTWLAISLAVAFEIGAAASLAAIIILEKTSRFMVWSLFLILTVVQAMGNTYYAFINLADFQGWIELFGLVDSELIVQKRILSIVSGAILPIVALGFIKSLVDYIRPEEPNKIVEVIKDDNLGFLGSEPKHTEEPINESAMMDTFGLNEEYSQVDEEGPYTFETDEEVENMIENQDLIIDDLEENSSKLVKLKDLVMEPPVEVEEIEPPVEVDVLIEEPAVEVNVIEQRLVEVDEIENDAFPHTMADVTDEQPPVDDSGQIGPIGPSGHVGPMGNDEGNVRSVSQPGSFATPQEEPRGKEGPGFNSLKKIGKDWIID